jgi:predicted Zn finger-like uncharacterized protein
MFLCPGIAVMPIQTHCPSCQTEYTLIDNLAGKYVRCERCRQSFRATSQAEAPRQSANGTPRIIVTPDVPEIPPAIVKTQDRARPSPPPRPVRSSGSTGGSGCSWGGLIFLAFFLIRGCMALTPRQQDRTREYRSTVSVPQFNQPIWKEKDGGKRFP